ncbi:MAG: hypothetical protein IPH13_09365 [Planctomycetes bacterium]|nr:hypothetical protein [Planctomycetota bacterium]MCC7170377.1 hypothetical protein [Planctomycetota bacterium]
MLTHRLALASIALFTLGCGVLQHDFGRLDPQVIEFAHQVDTTRGFELALDDDARVVGYAGAITAAQLPGLARDTALALAPQAVVRGGSRIIEWKRETWEVELDRDGARSFVRVRFDEEGVPHVVQTRRRADDAEVPAAVRTRAQAEAGAGSIVAIEAVEADSNVVYHVTKTVGSQTLRLAIARDGTLLETLRIVRCGLGVVDASR